MALSTFVIEKSQVSNFYCGGVLKYHHMCFLFPDDHHLYFLFLIIHNLQDTIFLCSHMGEFSMSILEQLNS